MVSVGQLVAKKGRKSRNPKQQLTHVAPLARFVLEILQERGLTPLQFAQGGSVGKSTLYNIIAATHEPTRMTMQRLAHDLTVVSGRIITSQYLDSLMYSAGIPDSSNAHGEKVLAIADNSKETSGTAVILNSSLNSLISQRGNSDSLLRSSNYSGSISMSHSPSDRHGLKLFAATLQIARMQARGEIAGMAISEPCTTEDICRIMAELTPIETITPDILDAAEHGYLEALPSELIPGIAALQYVTDERDRPYTSAQLSQIVLGQLTPINKQTGQPFTTADLETLGIHLNGCTLA